MLDYFVPSDYARCARKALTNCRMGKCGIMEYIDDFRRLLVCCTDVQESEAKFLFENNMANWLASYVLPYNCASLAETMLCVERIGGVQHIHSQFCPTMQYAAPTHPNPSQASGPVPMELGKFTGKCFRCGKVGHKKADCRVNLNKGKKGPVA